MERAAKAPREAKRKTLLELVEFVNTVGSGENKGVIYNETTLPLVVEMVGANIFRSLPPQDDDYDPDEDEPWLDPSWPHLQIVYEFLLLVFWTCGCIAVCVCVRVRFSRARSVCLCVCVCVCVCVRRLPHILLMCPSSKRCTGHSQIDSVRKHSLAC